MSQKTPFQDSSKNVAVKVATSKLVKDILSAIISGFELHTIINSDDW